MQPGLAPVRSNRARRAVAAALAAAFAVLLPAAITGAWINDTILSTSGYVAAVTPVAASPAARAAVRDAVTGGVGAGLAGLVRDGVSRLMASPAFPPLWADANQVAHHQLISVLNGDRAYRLLVATVSLVPVLAALALAGALVVSPRRTLLQLTIGGTLALLVAMIAVGWAQSSLIDRAAPPYQAVTGVIVHALTSGFFTTATWWVAGGGALTAIALVSGPYRWARAIRAVIRIGGLRTRLPGNRAVDRELPRCPDAHPPALVHQPGEGGRAECRLGRAARPVAVGSLLGEQRHPGAPAQ